MQTARLAKLRQQTINNTGSGSSQSKVCLGTLSLCMYYYISICNSIHFCVYFWSHFSFLANARIHLTRRYHYPYNVPPKPETTSSSMVIQLHSSGSAASERSFLATSERSFLAILAFWERKDKQWQREICSTSSSTAVCINHLNFLNYLRYTQINIRRETKSKTHKL